MFKNKLKKILFYSLIIFIGLGLTVLLWLFLNNQSSSEPWTKKLLLILRPFIIGGVIAYVMKGTCNFFDRIYKKQLLKSGKRSDAQASKTASKLSLLTTYLIWISVISVLIAITVKPLVESVKNLVTNLFVHAPVYVERATEFVNNKLANYPEVQQLFESAINSVYDKFNVWVETDLPNALNQIGAGLISGVVDIVVLIKDVFIGLIVSFLLLSGRGILAEKSKIFLHCIFKENTANAIIDEFKFADRMFSGFLEGKVIDSALIGVIYYIALLIMKAPYAPLIAVICGVTNIIPIFGPFIGAVPSALIIFTESPVTVIYFVVFVCIMQFIDGNIIDPHIVGGNIQISGLCVLFAVILFGGLWGFAGLLVGVPVFAVIYDIIKKIVRNILKKKNKEYLLDNFEKMLSERKEKKARRNKLSNRIMTAPVDSGDATPQDVQSDVAITDDDRDYCNKNDM